MWTLSPYFPWMRCNPVPTVYSSLDYSGCQLGIISRFDHVSDLFGADEPTRCISCNERLRILIKGCHGFQGSTASLVDARSDGVLSEQSLNGGESFARKHLRYTARRAAPGLCLEEPETCSVDLQEQGLRDSGTQDSGLRRGCAENRI